MVNYVYISFDDEDIEEFEDRTNKLWQFLEKINNIVGSPTKVFENLKSETLTKQLEKCDTIVLYLQNKFDNKFKDAIITRDQILDLLKILKEFYQEFYFTYSYLPFYDTSGYIVTNIYDIHRCKYRDMIYYGLENILSQFPRLDDNDYF